MEAIPPVFTFLAIIYTIVLLTWTKLNRSTSEDIRRDRRRFREEVQAKRAERRGVEGIRVIFRDLSDHTFEEARSYRYEHYDKTYEFLDADQAIIAEFPEREVSGVVMERVGETYER